MTHAPVGAPPPLDRGQNEKAKREKRKDGRRRREKEKREKFVG
jgi:hypothetical protein